MGVDYSASIGYGFDIKQILNEEQVEELLYGFKKLCYLNHGSCYDDDMGYFISIKRLTKVVYDCGIGHIKGKSPNKKELAEIAAVKSRLLEKHSIEITEEIGWTVGLFVF